MIICIIIFFKDKQRANMTIQSFSNNHIFNQRVYFDLDKDLKYTEVKKTICPVKGLEYKGAGIRCYNSFIGWILHCLSLATKVNTDGKTFYLNNKSLTKFVIRRCEAIKILKDMKETSKINKFEETVLRLDDLYRRCQGLGYDPRLVKIVSKVLKDVLPSGIVQDTDKLDDLFSTLQEAAEKAEKFAEEEATKPAGECTAKVE